MLSMSKHGGRASTRSFDGAQDDPTRKLCEFEL